MPVDLSPDLQTTGPWREVARRLAAELSARGLAGWIVSVRRRAHADLTDTGGVVVDRSAGRVTIDVPAAGDPRRPADEQAFAWADDIGLLVKGELGEPPPADKP